jgi:hypothetical protein
VSWARAQYCIAWIGSCHRGFVFVVNIVLSATELRG